MSPSPPVAVTFYGGLGEIGRNMATIEVEGRIGVIDCGVYFPDGEAHPGVDLIIPDWSELRQRADDVEAVFLTHGHEDHIGGLPYLMTDIPGLTIYGTPLTMRFLEAKLEEWPDVAGHRLVTVEPGDTIQHAPFEVEVVQVTHSIPDGCALAFRTSHGLVLHSGDFKLDQTPVDGRATDLAHLSRLGDEGVDLLLADSTNADRPGHVASEKTIGKALRDAFRGAEGLIVVASFASHVHRIQQVLDAAVEVGRRPVFVGRSMVRNMAIAADMGYLHFDPDLEVEMHEVDKHDRSQLCIISTGSQGEPYSALSLMASGDHRHLEVGEGDTVVLASSLIPGNERAVFRSINGLTRRGARVIHGGIAPVHVSGHASRDDLILYHNLVEPEYVVPVHGEYRHLHAHRDIAIDTGCVPDHVLICEDGDVVLLEDGRVIRGEGIQAGQIFIDGLLTDVGPAVLRDRRRLADDGTCICVVTIDPHRGEAVGQTLVIQKGVVFHEEEQPILEAATKAVDLELQAMKGQHWHDNVAVQRHVTQALGRFWRTETGRRPVIMPIVLEV
ncbi:MAG TPA: ribonuclease J [Nitriliruptorales bacterium]